MRRTILSRLILLLALAIIFLPIVFAQPAAALVSGADNSQSDACQGINLDQGTNACTTDVTSGLNGLVATIVNILSIIVGVAAVIMIIVGGFRYVTSGGDSNNTSGAKNTIIYALVGLVIAILAQVLVQFVLYKTG